jgi:hypothetical protein
MLIDSFNESFFQQLDMRAVELAASNTLYLLIDGAFVPGLHRMLAMESKSLLFASRPGCNDETADCSPFLTQYVPHDKRMRLFLSRCSGWPMVSLIETCESLVQLSNRLSIWCVVEADGQRFNFRFADTRRLPSIVRTLDAAQRAQFAGPATRYSYVDRTGNLNELDVPRSTTEPAAGPVLNDRQFASLVDDSQADELLLLLGDRGYKVNNRPSVGHARMTAAIQIAVSSELDESDVLSWCIWFLQHVEVHPDCTPTSAFETWHQTLFLEGYQ